MTSSKASLGKQGQRQVPFVSRLIQTLAAMPLLLLLPILLSSVLPIAVKGAESGPLLGGLYTPTTDVSYIVALSELVRAISLENDITNGTALYQTQALGKISLESIVYPGVDTASLVLEENDFGSGFLNPKTNVLYSLYMHAYWNSVHGNSGQDGTATDGGEPLARPYYNYLDEKVDYYAHSIINAEFSKLSGYDPMLTAETVRVLCLWSAAIQSLYDAVELCADAYMGDVIDGSGSNGTTTPNLVVVDVNDPSYISPVDRAAAFWSGDHIPQGDADGDGIPDAEDTDDFTLYLWADRIRTNFNNPIPGEVLFDANNEIVEGLTNMQTLLGQCLSSPSLETTQNMRIVAEDITRYMTIPLVQSLIHYAAGVVVDGTTMTTGTGTTVTAAATTTAPPATGGDDMIDWVILYGLVTIPPIRVCQDYAFDSLYTELVVNALADGNLSKDTFYDMLNTIQSRLVCLGVTCEQVGTSNTLSADNNMDADGGWPTCSNPDAEFDGYPALVNLDPDLFLEYSKVDLDVRTISVLVQMDAGDAAYDVYRWGRNMRVESARNMALMDLELETIHVSNDVGTAYTSFFDQKSISIGEHIREVVMGGGLLGLFGDATPGQRKIIVEWTFIAISLHMHALNAMYEAIDNCRAGTQETTWDRGVAALSGWAENTIDADGLLLMKVDRFLCQSKQSCDPNTNDSKINGLMMEAMTSGKNDLADLGGDGCTRAEASVASIKKLVLTSLVDASATFAELIAQDITNANNLAHGYGLAISLAPLMQTLDTKAFEIINSNLGVFGSTAQPMVNGKDEVLDALKDFVSIAGIDCSLLTSGLCDKGEGEGDVTTESTYNPTQNMSSSPSPSPTLLSICESDVDGGLPSKTGDFSQPLLGNAYTPTSNVDHIIKLTENVEQISNSATNSDGLLYYTQENDGVSLQCLMLGNQLASKINPLFIIYTYGLWISPAGDSDPDGYSSKSFDDRTVSNYGDAVVTDSFSKESGYIPDLTAETVRVLNMLMAMVTEMYRAGTSCLNSDSIGSNPIDFAAALWFGSAQDPSSSDGGSLYAWTQRAGANFSGQIVLIKDIISTKLSELQQSYTECVTLVDEEKVAKAVQMRHQVDDVTRMLFVPLVQNFIHHLASESGLTSVEPTAERYYVVLYSLAVLPLISICDEDSYDELFTALIEDIGSYDSSTFSSHITKLQARYECLGISCEMIGQHVNTSDGWPECQAASFAITGYLPTSLASREMWKIDLDVSTILTSIVMEANDAALDIFNNGRNAMSSDGTGSFLSLNDISIPSTNAEVLEIYQSFTSGSNGVDYTGITKSAIMGEEAFMWASVLKRSSAARLAIATIQMHMIILTKMYDAVSLCETALSSGTVDEEVGTYWDSAVAAAVGSSEGDEEGGSVTNGYFFFQLAQELCGYFNSCDSDGQSVLNNNLMAEFAAGQSALQSSQCDEALNSRSTIESLLQAILIDNLAYHVKAASNGDEHHCLMAHVASNALVPLIRRDIETDASANTIEESVVATSGGCIVQDVEAVYQALDFYVESQGINCTLLGSSVCDGTSITNDFVGFENNDGYTLNTDGNTLFNGEYQPMVDVTNIEALSSVVNSICNSNSTDAAKDAYSNDSTAGITIESMSLFAKYAMADELQLNQYIYALQDGADLTDGSLLFDNKPASEYANTITSDALDVSPALGCQSLKVHNIWMWIVHKLNSMIDSCKSIDEILSNSTQKGLIDEAAAFWAGSLMYDMAEELGPKFGHNQDGGMTFLNRKIVDRLKKARDIIYNTDNSCSAADVHDLRIIVRETISYMTAVLIQSLIDSMIRDYDTVAEKQQVVELMAFATLPRIKTCGHEAAYEMLQADLIRDKFQDEMLIDIMATLQSQYNCLGMTCDDVGRHTQDSMSPECTENLNIAGYSPVNATQTNMLARVDLDAVAIHQMMSMEKYDIAKRIYLEGHNYYDYDSTDTYNFVSLYNLTQSHTIDYVDFPMYQLFIGYYGTDFINELMMQILEQTGSFADMPATRRDLALDIAISNILSYIAALQALYYAARMCAYEDGGTTSLAAFDGAVALLVGSVEGPEEGGDPIAEGRMFYSITGSSCVYGDCIENEFKEELFQALTDGQSFIVTRDCESAGATVEKINALLKVPLLQSLIYFSDELTYDVADTVAAGYVATMAVIPIINEIDPTSAVTIETAMKLDDPSWTLVTKELEVRTALQAILSNPISDINCALVSTSGTLCGTAINPDEPMPISDGLYVSTNYVGDRSAIALDVKEIESFLSQNNADEATRVYSDGLNSKIHNANGSLTGKMRSIALFSVKSGSTMMNDPTYNLFIHGLSDENHEFMGRPATLYADSFVSNLLNSSMREASNAMVAISIWMQVAHSLHASYQACRQSSSSVDRHLQNSQLNDPSLFIDEAAAFWIGDNQDTGSSSDGHLLYALTEFIGEKFENTSPESESEVNMQIIDLFNKAKNHISISRGCSTGEDSHVTLLNFIDEIIPLMVVPLLRCLLFYLHENDLVLARVYATAALPLFSACSPATYNELKDQLINHDAIGVNKESMYSKIQSLYSCLGLTCDFVGFMTTDESLRCENKSDLKSLGGYRYEADPDVVNESSRIDVQMKTVEIFLDNAVNQLSESQEVLFRSSFDVYKASLRSIARDTNREVVPLFASFQRYFALDDYYADTMIANAFQKGGVFKGATIDQRKRVVTFAMRYMVTFMAVLEKIYSALNSCRQGSGTDDGSKNLDLAVAYYVGSLEGGHSGGSYDGSLIYMLAKRMCVHFQTCTSSNNAMINEKIVSLFYTAQGEVETGSCDSLERTVQEIENSLIVPLIQGTLFSARENEKHFKRRAFREFYPEGYVLAQSILPIMNDADLFSATEIKNVMVAKFPSQGNDESSNDSARVHSAIKIAISKMEGFDCTQVGLIGGSGLCPGDDGTYNAFSSAYESATFSITALSLSVMLFVLAFI